MNTIIQSDAIAFPQQPLTTQQITLKIYKDLKTNGKFKYDGMYVYQLKLSLEAVKSKMYFQSFVTSELVSTQLKNNTQKIYNAIVNFEVLLNENTFKLNPSQNKMIKDLEVLKQDIAIITMYLEV